MDDLAAQFRQQETAYEAAIKTGDIEAAAAANLQLSETLQSMLATVANNADLEHQKDALVKKLVQIQYDYNGLSRSTDQLETLRRIRSNLAGGTDSSLFFYLCGFFVIAVAVIILLFFKRPYKPTTPIVMSRPITTAAFT